MPPTFRIILLSPPVGGSLGTTAVNVLARAQTRWAVIFSGLSMTLIIVALSGIVAHTAMPSLAAMLILAGIRIIKISDIVSTWNSGWKAWPSLLAGGVAFGATLVSVLANYASLLQEVNGKLYLTGVSEQVYKEVGYSNKLHINGPVKAFRQEPALGLSTHHAVVDAEAWLLECAKKTSQD